jgi:zinc transport system permease protein
MNTLRFLTEPGYMGLFWPGVIAAIAIAVLCALLSPFVVLKRLSFVGQGISHAAFGGVGLYSVLSALGLAVAATPAGRFSIVLLFCLACALLIAALSQRGPASADTVIGIVLVGAMTLGAILTQFATTLGRGHARFVPVAWESILFGSIASAGWTEALISWAVLALIALALFSARRQLYFWAFDEPAAPAFGVHAPRMKLLLVVLLTLAIVTAMKIAGVVLATALLILPGAAALHLSDRLRSVIGLSIAICVTGVCLGLVLSFEVLGGNVIPPGAGIVAVLVLLYASARLAHASRSGRLGRRFAPRSV